MCQPFRFLCLVAYGQQAPFSSFIVTGTLGLHCAVQFGRSRALMHCFKTLLSQHGFTVPGTRLYVLLRVGWAVPSATKRKMLKEELES